MELKEILACCDHTLLKQDAVWEDIKKICDDGMEYKTASVCIPPSFVKQAKEYVKDKLKICTVIGFPNGYSTTAVKCFETIDAIDHGADEIDMVINIGWAKEGRFYDIEDEIAQVKNFCGDRVLKVIIETCLLTDDEKRELVKAVQNAGADFIKTSTGFGGGGATFEDVALMAEERGCGLKIKASGGISSLEDAERFIELGAERLGTSRIVGIAKNMK